MRRFSFSISALVFVCLVIFAGFHNMTVNVVQLVLAVPGEIFRIVCSLSTRPQIFLLALFVAPVLQASASRIAKYPIQIRIRSVSSACIQCGAIVDPYEWIEPYNAYYVGQGEGYLLDADTATAFEFSYELSRSQTPYSIGEQVFAARWKKKGKELELLVPDSFPNKPASPNVARFDPCTLKVTVGEPITLEQFQQRSSVTDSMGQD